MDHVVARAADHGLVTNPLAALPHIQLVEKDDVGLSPRLDQVIAVAGEDHVDAVAADYVVRAETAVQVAAGVPGADQGLPGGVGLGHQGKPVQDIIAIGKGGVGAQRNGITGAITERDRTVAETVVQAFQVDAGG